MARKRFRYPITTLAGTTVRNFLATCKGHKIEPKYYWKLVISLVVAVIFELFNFIERIFWQRKINRFKPAVPPVFIIGPWRSGTTLLHNLLCRDPNTAYLTTFQTVFPNVLLTQSWWLKPIARMVGPSKRPFDNVKMDMDFPQEEEFGLLGLQPSSIYKFFIFPSEFDEIVNRNFFTASLPENGLTIWKKKYGEIIAKSVFNTGGTRYISKNPCNLGRIGMLVEMFPDSKFIFIYRNPYKTVESLYRFILEVFPGVQLQSVPAGFSREHVVRLYEKVVRSYLKDRHLIDPKNLIEIKMEDFMKEPSAYLREIYTKFNIDNFDEIKPLFSEYLEKDEHTHNGAYEIDRESIRLVNTYLGDIMEMLRYEIINEV